MFAFAILIAALSSALASVAHAQPVCGALGKELGERVSPTSASQKLEPIPRSRALSVLPEQPQKSFKNGSELAEFLEREELPRLLDERRAYFAYEHYIKTMPEYEKAAVLDYKGAGYGKINEFLRSRNPDWAHFEQIREVADIDHAISAAPAIPKDIVLFRGMALWKLNPDLKKKRGEIIEDRGFVSTSLKAGTAMGFSGNSAWGAPGGDPKENKTSSVIQVIVVRDPKARGLFIESNAQGGEAEVLLARNSRFRVLRSEWRTLRNVDTWGSSNWDVGGNGNFGSGTWTPPPPTSPPVHMPPTNPGAPGKDTPSSGNDPWNSNNPFNNNGWGTLDPNYPFQYDQLNPPDPLSDPMDPWNSAKFEPPPPPVEPPVIKPPKPTRILVQYVELL